LKGFCDKNGSGSADKCECKPLAYGCPWDADTCCHAAMGGHMAVLQWARARGCEWDEGVCYEAAKGGHLEVETDG
jgi:hypothetical protein